MKKPHGEMTYREIGRRMGVSGTRVQQLEKNALRKLRVAIERLDTGYARPKPITQSKPPVELDM